MSGPRPLPDILPSLTTTVIEALAGANIGLTVMVDDGVLQRTIYQSEVAAAIAGYPIEEVLGRDSMFCVAPEERPAIEARRQRAQRGEPVPRTVDTILLRKDGTRVPVELGTCRVKLEGRDVIVAFMRDVSERVQAEAALRRSEGRFRRLIEAAPEAIGVARGGIFTYANPMLVNLLGVRTADQVVGHALREFLVPEEMPIVEQRTARIVRGDVLPAQEYRVRHPDGTIVSIEISSIAVEFEGEPAILGIARDITERKRLSEQLLHADRMATVGTLAAGVAHEINNPLAYITLILDRLRRELPSVFSLPDKLDDLLALVEEARGGAERVGAIVRDLRTFSRSDADLATATDLRRVLESSVKMAENEIRHRANLILEIDDLPMLDASEARLGQVFLNLLVNALQAIPEGNAAHHAIRVVARAAQSCVEVDVIDSGQGIAPEVLPRIFDPFFTTKPVGIGTGLGLPICRNIVMSMGGEITVDSEVGRGTRVRVRLPMRAPPSAPARAERPPSVPAIRTAPCTRVLIVDDEPALVSVLRRELEEDHEVTVSTTGRDALAKLLEGDFDVVVCDVMMPDLSGIDLHEELSRNKPGCERRMIFMTGGTFTPRAERFFERSDVVRIDKPFRREALREAIRNVAVLRG